MTLLQLLAGLFLLQSPSPLLSYQAMEALKETLADRTVEVEVVAKVPDGADPSIAPVMVGQAVCVADPSGRPHLVTSAFLVEASASLRVRCRQSPEWLPATLRRVDTERGLAELHAADFRCRRTPAATPALESKDALVFAIDNPTEWVSIFHGFLWGIADPPLADYLLASSGLPLGGPLFAADGSLVAINLRRYAPGGSPYLSAPATLIWKWVWGTRRPAADEQRKPRRPGKPVP
jgi:hypothetical protein